MSGPGASPRSCHFKPGTEVMHQTMGIGRILGEWGPIKIDGLNPLAPCPIIYDVAFPNRVLCCRAEYLERIAIAPGRPGRAPNKRLTAPR
jgi:hypothetical protein